MPAVPNHERPIDRLLEIMSILRGPDGCPWDREQSLETLKQYLLEETYEVLDAIDSGDRVMLEDELGDLLLQIVFQAQLCREEGSFDFDGVASRIGEKLVRRHPHVFGDIEVDGSAEVLKNWEAIKKQEKGDKEKSATDGIPHSFPALMKAEKLQRKVSRIGFDWDDVQDVVQKVDEELDEVKKALASGDREALQAELGDLLFATVNLTRSLEFNAEDLLNASIRKFIRRFKSVEKRIQQEGKDLHGMTLAEMDVYWDAVKREEG